MDKKQTNVQNIDEQSSSSQEEKRVPVKDKFTKRAKKVFHVFDKVFDYLLIPLLILCIFFASSLIITKKTKGIPMIAGYSLVKISSGSMRDYGFEIGDFAMIKQQKSIDDYKVGDYIAFFECVDSNVQNHFQANESGLEPTKDPRASRIIFHEIMSIVTDNNGKKWFITKGVNNKYNDVHPIYEDYVIGKYKENLDGLANFIKFLLSIKGALLVIVLPCSIIVFKDCLVLVNIIFEIQDEKKQKKTKQPLGTIVPENTEANKKSKENSEQKK
mgnify:FL=1